MRDSRINLIFEGTNEILRTLIALMGLQQPGENLKTVGKAFKDPIHSLGAIGHYLTGRAKRTIIKPVFGLVHPSLVDEGEVVATLVHDLALAVEASLMRHGNAIVDLQFLQERMANAAIDIFVASAVLSRTTWEITRAGDESAAQEQIDCARVFVAMAARRTRRNIRALSMNQDKRLKSIAVQSLAKGELGPSAPTDV